MPTFQFFVKGIDVKTATFMIDQDADIEQIFTMVSERYNIPSEEIRLIYRGKELQRENAGGRKRFLVDYQIFKHSTLFMAIRLDSTCTDNPDERRIQRSSTSIPFTSRSEEPDILSLEDDLAHPRAKLPCGHAIGPCSLFYYARHEIYTKASHEIKCPICPEVWDYPIIRDYAALTGTEREDFETRLTFNFAQRSCTAHPCPKCNISCERKGQNNPRVICTSCSKKRGHNFEFCWFCLHEWKSGNTTDCGNNDCWKSGQLYVLNHCGTKKIAGVPNCPIKRACPWCFTIIEHDDVYKHVHCRVCGEKFCFICLSKKINGKWSCGSYNSKCTVAPVQRTLN